MEIINIYKFEIFDDFFCSYSNTIENRWSHLKNVTIDVYDISKGAKEFVTNNGELGNCSAYINSPFQCYPNYKFGNKLYNDIIMNKKICSQYELTENEQKALIAHEIGHFVNEYEKIGKKGLDEEIFADEVAVFLGFKTELKSALGKCPQNCDLKKRIDTL